MNILFVNACVRGEASNTLKLCRVALEELRARYPDAEITEVNLEQERPQAFYPENLNERDALRREKNWAHPMFRYAQQFAAADKIVIGAPYWDLAFPAVLRIYFEHICVVDITFRYTADGQPVGCCQADELLYITTAGGPVEPYPLGFTYIKGLCEAFLGIRKQECYALCGLEMGGDIVAMVREGEAELRAKFQSGTL